MSHRAYPLLVIALVFLAHAPALDSGFHYDDQHSLLENPHIRALGNLPRRFHKGQPIGRETGLQ